MPSVDGYLAGDQGGAAAVTVFDDFQHVMALFRPQRLETPIVENQELDTAEGAHQTRVAAVAACQGEIAEQARYALVEDRAVIAACLVTEGASQPAFADARRNSVILPGFRLLRFGSAIRFTRAAAKRSQCSVQR